MESLATAWENGVRVWRVHHDAQQGIRHLTAVGTLPPRFVTIRDSHFEEQEEDADVDHVFDIPCQLVKELGGFTYDQFIAGAGPQPFQVLRQT